MGRYYILRGDDVAEEPDYARWARWYEDSYQRVRCVASTKIRYGTVSTVFLGVNMTLSKNAPPQLFETLVEGGWMDGERQTYATLEEAKTGHELWVARVDQAEADRPPPPGFVW